MSTRFERALLFIVAGLVPGIIIFLLVVNFWTSLINGTPGTGTNYTVEHYVAVYADPFTYTALTNTLFFAFITVGVALLIGVPIAWLAERTDLPYKTLLYGLMVIGLLIPTFFVAMGWLFLLHPRIGFLNAWLVWWTGSPSAVINISTIPGMGFVEGISLAPLAFIMTAAAFRAMDPALEEAAFVHRMGATRTFLFITLPLVLPSVLASALYIFIIGFSAFDVPAVIGLGNRIYTFSTMIYVIALSPDQAPKYGIPAAVGALMFIVAVLLTWSYTRILRFSKRYEIVSGRSYQVKRLNLGGWWILAWSFLAFYLFLSIGIPLLLVGWASLLPYFQPPSWRALSLVSLGQFTKVPWELVTRGATNSLLLMLSVPTVTLALCIPVAWVILRSGSRWRYVYEFFVFLPHAMPSIVFGVAALIASLFILGDAVPIYGTVWIIAAVYLVERMTFGSRVMNGALIQIHRELEEAGYVSGLSIMLVLRNVFVPLLLPAIVNAWLWLALITYRELTVAAVLFSPSNITLPVVIWNLLQGGQVEQAAALTLVMVTVLSPLVLIYWYASGRKILAW